MKQKRKRRVFPFARWALIKGDSSQKFYTLCEDKSLFHKVEKGKKYANHIETSGFKASSIISYGNTAGGRLRVLRHVIFPGFRLFPNETSSHLSCSFKGVSLRVNSALSKEIAEGFRFGGTVQLSSKIGDIKITRTLFAARTEPCLVEIIKAENAGGSEAKIEAVIRDKEKLTAAKYGKDFKRYRLFVKTENGSLTLKPGECGEIYAYYCAAPENGDVKVSAAEQYRLRMDFIDELDKKLIIETPDENINAMARFAKIRAAESIFETKNGLMHCPGGGGYYAALWTNDQCEYVNPLFGYLGYDVGRREAENCYTLYQKYISPDKALITSIVGEGDGIWHGAGDRGDSSMYACGASRYLLSLGDRKTAEKYLASIRDCIDYFLSQKTADGVIASDSDELENRFKSGKANLSTSCLSYDALKEAAYLEDETGSAQRAEMYRDEAEKLRRGIEKYFGRNVEGYETYRYCEEEKKLRSWICLPLVMGIFDRSGQTAEALMSEKLKKGVGLVTRSGNKTFWDRSTLYALRGLFFSGETEDAAKLLKDYSDARLLGRHVPYAVEAYPEGNQAQLSAESGLYLRIFTEGILGYIPTGFNKFTVKPSLPSQWDFFSIKNFCAHGKCFDIDVRRTGGGYDITLSEGISLSVAEGEEAEIKF